MSDTASAAPIPAAIVPASLPVAPADSPKDRRIFWLATGIVIITLLIVLLLFFVTIPAANKDILSPVIGLMVGTGFGSVVGYFFGSSEGSKSKDAAIIGSLSANQ